MHKCRLLPMRWVQMFPVSVWIRNIDLKHSQNELSCGRCPLIRKSLSRSHFGRWWWCISSQACLAISSALCRALPAISSALCKARPAISSALWNARPAIASALSRARPAISSALWRARAGKVNSSDGLCSRRWTLRNASWLLSVSYNIYIQQFMYHGYMLVFVPFLGYTLTN